MMAIVFLPLFFFVVSVFAQLSPDQFERFKEDLIDRGIDPDADPVRFSVLAALATTVPTPPAVLVKGELPPSWYSQLSEDVKQLLQTLYPAHKDLSTDTAASPTTMTTTVMIGSFISTAKELQGQPPAGGPTSSYNDNGVFVSYTSTPTDGLMSNIPPYPTTDLSVFDPINGTGSRVLSGPTMSSNTTGASRPTDIHDPRPPRPRPSATSLGSDIVVQFNTIALILWITVSAGFFLLG